MAKSVENIGREEESSTDFRLYACHEPRSQWIATPGSFRAMVVVEKKGGGIV